MKKLSSYNIKWIAIYIVYATFMWLVEGEEIVFDRKEDGYSFDFTLLFILLPLLTYIFFPALLRVIGNLKIIKFFDIIIDFIYRSIKEHC